MTAIGPAEFEASLDQTAPPSGLRPPLLALWHSGRGEWDRAHEVVQPETDAASAWVHAHLHREEGDASNAGYWYRRSGRSAHAGALRDEWRAIVAELLSTPRT